MKKSEIVFIIRDLKAEFEEAVEKGIGLTGAKKENNLKYRNKLINEILRLESLAKEFKEEEKRVVVDAREIEITFEIEKDEDTFRQQSLVTAFRNKFKQIYNEKAGVSDKAISEKQRETILSGMRDRVGLEIDQSIMKLVNALNFSQASELIDVLKTISFYGQRQILTKGVKKLSNREDYAQILTEVNKNIFKMAWFKANPELIRVLSDMEEPTEAQVNKIANVARYPETYVALKELGIDIYDYEDRAVVDGELRPYYTMNWDKLKLDIKTKLNREEAYNFIQTYDYITNYYEGRQLESHERNHIRNLYIQLGDYDRTRPSHMNTILKQHYELLANQLEEQVRINKIANTQSTLRWIEDLVTDKKRTKKVAREVRSVIVKQEQEEAKEFTSFIFGLYAEVGQEVPDEARRILPYFVQGGECKYATVEEQHYKELRKLVFEQREVIKRVDKDFNWGAFICNQPTHILKALGLDIMM